MSFQYEQYFLSLYMYAVWDERPGAKKLLTVEL